MIKPHGADQLNPLFVADDTLRQQLVQEAENLPAIVLNSASAANAVMLGAGYFTPLGGYMNVADALNVSSHMQTTDGTFWPVTVMNRTDDVSAIEGASRIALRDPNVDGNPVLAIQEVTAIEEVTTDQLNTMAAKNFGTLDENHPGVATFMSLGKYVISGPIQVLNYSYFATDFPETFRTAQQISRHHSQQRLAKGGCIPNP